MRDEMKMSDQRLVGRNEDIVIEDCFIGVAAGGIGARRVLPRGSGAGEERRFLRRVRKQPPRRRWRSQGRAELDADVRAIYDVISGPPESAGLEPFNALFTKMRADCRAVPRRRKTQDLAVMTPATMRRGPEKYFLEHGFFRT